MINQTLDEWLAEATKRYGALEQARFSCPKCGNVASLAEFGTRGLDEQLAYQECIGRHDNTKGCDWTSAGIGGTMGKGRLISLPEARQLEVFDFA
jgi:hypothetical protein